MMKKIIAMCLVVLLCVSLAVSVSASGWEEGQTFFYDEADLLTPDQDEILSRNLEEVSRAYNAQMVVITVPSVEDGDVAGYANDLYDAMGFGYGANHDGVLLLVSMAPREYQFVSNGYASEAVGPDEIDILCGVMSQYLPEGNYATAFYSFANLCEGYLDGYVNGYPFQFGRNLVICLVIGLVAGLIVAFVLKGQLKSVRMQYRAHSYVKQGSMQLQVEQDIFLYRTMTRTRREKDNDSGSRSSGGSGRSSGGGSF